MGECRNTAIVLAAGQGKRMHSKIQKQFMELNGMPVLCYSLRCFQESPLIRDIILVTGEEHVSWCREEIVEKYGFTKVSAAAVLRESMSGFYIIGRNWIRLYVPFSEKL